ncbi:putative Flp pilus assembly protein CpaB [Corynebacterium pseudogenitalium ATCC 33035]|uniref:Putative Flp pilus assembly protein CpaB n=2 Tax=Corynebacterium pseudogenitalium TaxID=38303 RepID=E2S528_9CORY|nr:SAF domain-containing protein [Corynebacterium pseudogenitalium]EFQ80464.1 putative Flp pilus assembly protein CpaB [Corynebacterium pseudogenitalium ATCC 33035]
MPRLVSTLRTPGHRRGVVVRRAVAVALLIAALASALSAAKELPRVPVFSRDLPAGAELALADVDLARLPSSSIPDSAVAAKPEELTGRVITAAAGKGEVITDARLLGEELVSSLVGGSEDAAARMIPVKLAEPDIIPHLHHGDTVDVVTAVDAASSPSDVGEGEAPTAPTARVIATGGRVVSTSNAEGEASSSTVLLALPHDHANDVAAASLSQPLTVVIVGDRAHPQQS